jgi:hypothetical protein
MEKGGREQTLTPAFLVLKVMPQTCVSDPPLLPNRLISL